MKKNKMMRLASSLLVAVLLTSSVISGTFAKYVTEATGSDTARVAKWGVQITANGEMFADAYTKTTGDTAGNWDDAATLTVRADTKGTDVVAPGTKGNMATMKLSGIPEVDVKVSYEATVTIENWVAYESETDGTGTKYFPLVIEVDGTPVSYTTDEDPASIAQKIKEAIEDNEHVYPALTDLSGKGADAVTVTWEWDFDDNGLGTNDVMDTRLGNWDLFHKGEPRITVEIKTIVEQID